jgi:outer membrane protein assembly factor BamB
MWLLRVDGSVDGRGLPKLAWKWSARPIARFDEARESPSLAQSRTVLEGMRDVPQFFGPDRNGTLEGTALAPDWKAAPPELLWRKPIGLGWSAFAVVNGRAFTQEQREQEELVTCYDVATGALVWKHASATRFSQWQGGDGPRATPTVADGRVYAYGATGILKCSMLPRVSSSGPVKC